MAFKAGAVYGEAIMNTSKWESGLKKMAKGTAGAMAVIGGTITAVMAKNIAVANNFQKEMSNVSTVIDTTQISTQGLTQSLLQMDSSLGNTTELTNGLYQAFSAGAEDAEEAIEITTNSAKFAKAGVTDISTAVDVLTTATNAYGKENMNSTKASDLFFKTIERGKITGSELSQVIGQSIPLYASAGIGMEELTSGIATMTKQGVKASEATTQMNGIVNAFLKPSEEMNNALLEMGYSSGSAFLEAEGLTGALKLMEEATGGDAAKIAELVPNIKGMAGVMSLTGVGGEEFAKTLEAMGDSAGATDIAFQKQEKTFETFKNSLHKVQVVTGNIGKHFVDKIAGGATTATEGILDLIMSSRGMEIFGNVTAYVAGIFNAVKSAIAPIVDTLGPVLNELLQEGAEFMGRFASEGEAGAGASNALAMASAVASSALKILGSITSSTIENLSNLVGAVTETGKTVGTFFKFLKGEASFDDVKNQALSAGQAFKTFAVEGVGNIVDLVQTSTEEITGFLGETKDISTNITTSFEQSSIKTKNFVTSNWAEMLTGQEDFNEDLVESDQEREARQKEIRQQGMSNFQKNLDDMYTKYGEWTSRIFGASQELWNGLVNTESEALNTQQNNLEYKYVMQQQALEKSFEDGLLTEGEYNTKKEALELNNRKKQQALAKKQFEAQKKNDIANVWIETAGAIAGYWKASTELGWLAGPIYAGAMTTAMLAMGAKQSSDIAGRKFIPAFEKGGTFSAGAGAMGLAQINERGGEIAKLPDGTIIVPNDISRQIAGSVGGNNMLYFDFREARIDSRERAREVVNMVDRSLGRRARA